MASSEHPQTRDHLRFFLAQVGFPKLIAAFLAAMVFTSGLLAIGYRLSRESGDPSSFLTSWRWTFMTISGFPLDGTLSDGDSATRQAMLALTAVGGLVFPSLFLGAVVFRLLVAPDVFVFRKEVALMEVPEERRATWTYGEHYLAVRGYSATKLKLLDLEFGVISQNYVRSKSAGELLVNTRLEAVNPTWPLADQHVPYTLLVPLEDKDVEIVAGRRCLLSIQGVPVGKEDTLFVHVSGKVPALGSEFTERHSFLICEAVSERAFGDVTVDRGAASRTWKGWEAFD